MDGDSPGKLEMPFVFRGPILALNLLVAIRLRFTLGSFLESL